MVDGKYTINQARGVTRAIADRMDLTLECVRRYYMDPEATSPLAETFGRYPEFFELFGDFRGYVEFWLLENLVAPSFEEVKFLLPFDEFETRVARNLAEWNEYRMNSVAFCEARNERIQRWATKHLAG